MRLVGSWLGRQDSNLRMPGSKPGALPLGDAPSRCGRKRFASASKDPKGRRILIGGSRAVKRDGARAVGYRYESDIIFAMRALISSGVNCSISVHTVQRLPPTSRTVADRYP